MTDGLPPLVDTHCHLVLLDERGLLDAALEGAAAAGVDQIISVGLNVDDSDRNRQIAEAHPDVYFTVGWHPHEKTAPDAHELAALEALLHHPKAVAVGEVGLDLFFRPGYHEVPLDVQQRSFRSMLELAQRVGKPVLIHDRDAHEEVLAAVGAVPGSRGVMHCFSGDAAFARRCAAAGFIASFSGIVLMYVGLRICFKSLNDCTAGYLFSSVANASVAVATVRRSAIVDFQGCADLSSFCISSRTDFSASAIISPPRIRLPTANSAMTLAFFCPTGVL